MKRLFALMLAVWLMLTAAYAESPAAIETPAAAEETGGIVEVTAEPATGTAAEVTAGPTDAAADEPEPTATLQPTAEPTPTPVPGRLAGLKIGIDPGHQEHGNNEKELVTPGGKEKKPKVSSGTSGRKTRIPEYVTVLEIAFKLRDALEAEGAEVKMTRETHDVNISNQERAIMMNEWGADLVLRIHCDGTNKKSANGIGLFVNKSFDISAESKKAAEAILPRMVEATGAKKRGVYQRDTYTGLNWSEVPCILVECGYLTNPDEDVRLNDAEYQQKLAEGMVEGICDYFERQEE